MLYFCAVGQLVLSLELGTYVVKSDRWTTAWMFVYFHIEADSDVVNTLSNLKNFVSSYHPYSYCGCCM